MVRIALVEDDSNYRKELLEYLRRYARESGEHFSTAVFTDGAEIAEGYQANYDIILMDIAMAYMDGMRTAETIRQVDDEVVIIFITNMPQFVMKGYSVGALDYVLKPVSYFAFSQRIQRALSRMRKRSRRYITIPFKGGMRKLAVSEVTYVEVRDHDLTYHTAQEQFPAKGTLSEAEALLGSDSFFRCSKCYLVNLEYVDGMDNSSILIGADRIQVSRARKKALMDALNNYINEVSK
ncbi:MAG: response regulator transcription factor [Oscillospiraceae bacterium]|nr:response regulator transcription factor [Oscillospiraceae bacterium]